MEESERDVLKMGYENTVNWIRHYDGLLAGVNLFVASIVLGYAGLKLQIYGRSESARVIKFQGIELIEALFPFSLILLAFGFTIIIDRECRRAYRRLIGIERALGFYKPMEALNNNSLLEKGYQRSGEKSPFMCAVAYALHVVLGLIVFLLLAMF